MHFIAPGLEVGPAAALGGKGVFTTRRIAANELLVVWGGQVMTTAEMLAMPGEEAYSVQIEDDLHLVTPPDKIGIADFINYSCEPNALLSGQVSLIAARDIEPGEEIRFDYATSDSDWFDPILCQCATRSCRGWIRADDWQDPHLRQRYGRAFSPYLLRRLTCEAAIRPGAVLRSAVR